jgi:hypothetical protein
VRHFLIFPALFLSVYIRRSWAIHVLMRKQFKWAARFILAALIASFSSCQSGAGAGNGSKENVTDPNTSFSNPGTRTE